MKITVFYSWQSDLTSKYNRNLIETAIRNALQSIKLSNKEVSEINLVSDSRDEIGTPDLHSGIFEKIEESDIFVADISIINSGSNFRLTPNPNVLIELFCYIEKYCQYRHLTVNALVLNGANVSLRILRALLLN